MKRAIILLFPILGFADITNVRVIGTTPTQAILAYTAPDNGACTVAVSASPSYTPLAHDVAPALFSGANSDSRPGNINSGRSRVFIAGKRSVETDLASNNSSRALQAATLHYFRITCPSDGSTATGTFTTQTIPGGVGYGDPIPIDPANNGNYLYPTFSTTDRTSSVIDPLTGALVKNLTLSSDLTDVGFGINSSGLGFLCNPTPVKASDENKYGYHCQLSYANGVNNLLYWIAPDGEARFLGVMNIPYSLVSDRSRGCHGALSHTMSNGGNPNIFYCDSTITASGKHVVYRGTYAGHDVGGHDASMTGQLSYSMTGLPYTTFTAVTPDARDLGTLTNEFDPRYSTYIACCSTYYFSDWMANEQMMWYSYGGSQDTLAWATVFDVNATAATQTAKFGNANGCVDNPPITGGSYSGQAGCVIASTGTFTGGPGNAWRWSTMHTMEATEGTPGYLVETSNDLNGALAYSVTLTSALNSNPGSCAMAKPAGNWITDWPNSSWSSGCSTITVSGEPATTYANYPTPLAAQVGDLLSRSGASRGSYICCEILRLLDKGSDGKTWYLQRQYLYGTFRPLSTVSIGGNLYMLSPGVNPDINQTGWRIWWDYVNYPLNDSHSAVIFSNPQHMTYSYNPTWGRMTFETTSASYSSNPADLLNLPLSIPIGRPLFNGIGSSLAVETHPSLSVTNPATEADYRQAVDGSPYYGNTAIVTAGMVSLVSGQLYKIHGSTIGANYKLIPYFGSSGYHAMKEISGPSATLATDSSTQYEWCVALAAGECYAGSAAGDVYFNAPGIVNAYCHDDNGALINGSTINPDICVTPSSSAIQALQAQEIVRDPYGLQFRAIAHSFFAYKSPHLGAYWNARTIPDGSWAFTISDADSQIKLFKIPIRQVDSINRTTYVPISVSLPAVSGVDNAIIQFGYGENGDPGSFYCTARQEACVAQSGIINASQPFYFATTEAASITGMPCRSGCTITIPGLPGRVVYYGVISRDSLGKVVGRQSGAQAVP